MQNTMMVFTFFALDWKIPVWENFVKNCLFKVRHVRYNYFYNTLKLFDVLPSFPFITSEVKHDYL